jgi:Fic family protein
MHAPSTPPRIAELLLKLSVGAPQRPVEILQSGIGTKPTSQYLHWDELRHKPTPPGFSHEEWWLATKIARQAGMRELPLLDKANRAFTYGAPDVLQALLHQADINAAGQIQIPELVTTEQNKDRYIVGSLMEEAITSSQLEGAATTSKVAKDMLQRQRKPKDRGEHMIVNNYQAMQFIRAGKDQPLTPEMILTLQEILTKDTLDESGAAGRWRKPDEDVTVVDHRNSEALHIPPHADEIPERMARLCDFANSASDEPFIHPVVRAILLHFMMGYDHPFVDGNGRTARALFYWCMANRHYWLIEYISISRVIKKAPAQYVRAYLHTETDDSDTTYFLIHQLQTIDEAIKDLQVHLQQKVEELRDAEQLLGQSPALYQRLNHRQLALLGHALKSPRTAYMIDRHQSSHHVTYQTARTDLLDLVTMGLLEKSMKGRAFMFTTPDDLRERLNAIRDQRPTPA